MRKKIAIIGKILILLGILWPIPTQWILQFFVWVLFRLYYQIYNFPYDHQDEFYIFLCTLDEISRRYYWWPLLGIFVAGIIVCMLSNYKSNKVKCAGEQIKKCFPTFKDNPILPFFCWLWLKMLKAIGYIYAVTLVLIVLYLGFHPDYAPYVFWSFWGLLIIGGCLWFAYRVYRDYDKKDDDNQK